MRTPGLPTRGQRETGRRARCGSAQGQRGGTPGEVPTCTQGGWQRSSPRGKAASPWGSRQPYLPPRVPFLLLSAAGSPRVLSAAPCTGLCHQCCLQVHPGLGLVQGTHHELAGRSVWGSHRLCHPGRLDPEGGHVGVRPDSRDTGVSAGVQDTPGPGPGGSCARRARPSRPEPEVDGSRGTTQVREEGCGTAGRPGSPSPTAGPHPY